MIVRCRRWFAWGMVAVALVVAGCAEPTKPVNNAPPQGQRRLPRELEKNYIYMADNAILHDSAVADVHFVPHRAELNGLGVKRLTRMAEVLGVCGGVVHYETGSTDTQLVSQRVEAVRAFLASAGPGTEGIEVQAGVARGRGVSAAQVAKAVERLDALGDKSADGGLSGTSAK